MPVSKVVPLQRRAYTVMETAAALGFPAGEPGRKRVLRLIHAGELPARRLGRSYLIPVAALDQLVDATD